MSGGGWKGYRQSATSTPPHYWAFALVKVGVEAMQKFNILVGVRNIESRTNESAINKDGRDLFQLGLSIDVALLILTGELLYSSKKALNKRRSRVDLQELLLLRILMHKVKATTALPLVGSI